MSDEKYIRIGLFNSFKGEDSILISADIHGLLELESAFLELIKMGKSIYLTDLNCVDKKHEISITLSSDVKDEGLKKVSDNYLWTLTPKKWKEFRQKTIELCKNGIKGHQYLDSDSEENSDLQVVLSLNEYDIEFWNKFEVHK